ncbi:hypothetical protein BGW38_003669, partial [Lunasporangiospora selenospora]
NGVALVEEMIEAITQGLGLKSGCSNAQSELPDRATMLQRIVHVQEQYNAQIEANPWLKEQLIGVNWI